MDNMFYGCSSLISLNLNNCDTSLVTTMRSMFYGCSSLSSLDLSSFDTSNVTSMQLMVADCSNLITIYVSNSWTISAVTNGSGMFQGCSAIKGQNNTSYSSSNKSYTMAVIDTEQTPGYLTFRAH